MGENPFFLVEQNKVNIHLSSCFSSKTEQQRNTSLIYFKTRQQILKICRTLLISSKKPSTSLKQPKYLTLVCKTLSFTSNKPKTLQRPLFNLYGRKEITAKIAHWFAVSLTLDPPKDHMVCIQRS